ncbi:hypothetical protein [Citricoccus sp. GCM10030269]|uniref:hypothetical protein n=1 Tax=Citricoccus sp. GCM10030269 TaxID=3273388 RepID=UPI003620B8BC
MRAGPFARRRQAKRDDQELGNGLWRRGHDWFHRSLDRYWQVVEEAGKDGTIPQDQLNGLAHAGNVLADLMPRVRKLCMTAHREHPGQGMEIPGAASEVHRILSRAANDLATTAQAATMFRLGQTSLDSVGRRAEKVVAAVEEAEEAAARMTPTSRGS